MRANARKCICMLLRSVRRSTYGKFRSRSPQNFIMRLCTITPFISNLSSYRPGARCSNDINVMQRFFARSHSRYSLTRIRLSILFTTLRFLRAHRTPALSSLWPERARKTRRAELGWYKIWSKEKKRKIRETFFTMEQLGVRANSQLRSAVIIRDPANSWFPLSRGKKTLKLGKRNCSFVFLINP